MSWLIGRAVEVAVWSRIRQQKHNFDLTIDKVVSKAVRTAHKEYHGPLDGLEDTEATERVVKEHLEAFIGQPEIQMLLDDYHKLDRDLRLERRFRDYAVFKGWKNP